MRFDYGNKPLERKYKEIIDFMSKNSKSLPTKNLISRIIISKLKLKRRMICWRNQLYADLRSAYWNLQIFLRTIPSVRRLLI